MEKIIYQEKDSSIFLYIIIFFLSLLTIGKMMRVEKLKAELKEKMVQEIQDLHKL